MALTPKKIYKDFKSNKLDKVSAADLLVYLINNSIEIEIRINCIKILEKINHKDKKTFTFLENLLITESDIQIRISASRALKVLFGKKALAPLEWALDNLEALQGSIIITSMIAEINDDKTKLVLINRLKNLQDLKFMKSLRSSFKSKTINTLSNKQLANILNNYFVINFLKQKLAKFEYHVSNGFVTELDLSNINDDAHCWEIIKNLPEIVVNLKELVKLNLKSSRLGAIPVSINSLSCLSHLDLSYNLFQELPKTITSLTSLQYLDLQYNKLTNLPNSIGTLKSLEVLKLRHNNLSTLPNSFANLDSLKVLDLHGNQISKIPKFLVNLSSLEILEMGLNNLKYIPKWIKNLNSLKKLGLSGNKKLHNLNEWLNHLPPLKTLNLTNINMNSLPKSIGSFTSLEELTLNNNQLTILPNSFMNLTSLKKLNLSWNNFTFLPDWIDALSNLEELNLSGNKFKTLPASIGFLSSLKILNLESNMDRIVLPKSIKELRDNGLKIYQ